VPRLGELLVAAGVISAAQLEEGLRAQVIHGARLGTNLVELGHAELDDVAVALARQHAVPPAMRRHFERCDPDVQSLLPTQLAARHLVVPIGYLAGDTRAVMIASRDPLPDAIKRELEDAMGLPPGGAVVAICGELRIRYFLERGYGIPRPNRFLRVRRSPTQEWQQRPPTRPGAGAPASADGFSGETWGSDAQQEDSQYRTFEDTTGKYQAVAPDEAVDLDDLEGATRDFTIDATPFEPSDDFHIEETPVDHIIDPPAPGTSWRRPTPPAGNTPAPEPAQVDVAPAPRAMPLGGEELRRFVDTLAEPSAPALGRIAIQRVSVQKQMTTTGSGSGEVAEAADVARIFAEAESIEDIARAIRRGHSRNRVGELAIGALRKYGTGLDAGLIFIVRDDVAIGWKGFVRGVTDLVVDELAVPLDAPTVIAAAARDSRALLIDGAHGTDIDRRLWTALGKPAPGQVAVAPVVLAGHPVCLVYGQGASMSPFAELFAAVTQATTTAFARLLRAAQR
jgi:hypothetical protein